MAATSQLQGREMRIKQQFEYRDGEITKKMRGNFDREGESTCTYSEFPFVYGAELVLSSWLGGEAASRLARPSSPHRMANATRQRLTTSRPLLRLSPPPPRWCSPPPPPHGPPRRTTDGKNMSTVSKKSSTSTHTFAPPAPPFSSPSMLMYDVVAPLAPGPAPAPSPLLALASPSIAAAAAARQPPSSLPSSTRFLSTRTPRRESETKSGEQLEVSGELFGSLSPSLASLWLFD